MLEAVSRVGVPYFSFGPCASTVAVGVWSGKRHDCGWDAELEDDFWTFVGLGFGRYVERAYRAERLNLAILTVAVPWSVRNSRCPSYF